MATKTIGSAGGRDYATLAAWATYVNALALTAPEIGQMFNDSEFSVAAKVSFGGWTGNSATNTVTLTTGTGQSFIDNASVQSNVLNYVQANGVGISGTVVADYQIAVTGCNFIFQNFQLKVNGAGGGHGINWTGTTGLIQDFIMECVSSAASAELHINSTNMIGQKGAIICQVNNQIGISQLATGVSLYHMTVVCSSGGGTGTGIISSVNNMSVCENCVSYGFSANFSGTCNTSGGNATDAASFAGTGWGTSGQTSIVGATELVSVANGSEDLRRAAGSVNLKAKGVTGGSNPTTDIVGTSFGATPDIGCWEYVAAATQSLFLPSLMNGLDVGGPFFANQLG